MLAAFTVSHRHAPLSLLEQLAYPPAEIEPSLRWLVQQPGVREAVILSTCHRVEVYVSASAAEGPSPASLGRLLAVQRGVPGPPVDGAGLRLAGNDVATHLFSVSSGLDSMVVGEQEVFGQVRAAFASARQARTVGSELDGLFRWAIAVGRRVRRETGLGRSGQSIARQAVEVAAKRLGGFRGRTVLVLGAGKLARAIVDRLVSEPEKLILCNRTPSNATQLTTSREQVYPFEELERGLAAADVCFSCAAADMRLIREDTAARSMVGRKARPLLIVDLSMPRVVDAGVGHVPGVEVVDLERLASLAQGDAPELPVAVSHGIRIVEEEVARFATWSAERQAGDLIAALRGRVEDICRRELDHALGDHSLLTRDEAYRILQRALANLLHFPTVAARQAAASGDDALMATLRRVFQLAEVDDWSGSRSNAEDDAAARLVPLRDGLHPRNPEPFQESVQHRPVHVAHRA